MHLSEVKVLVLDEADKMLDLGFQEEVDRLLALLPKQATEPACSPPPLSRRGWHHTTGAAQAGSDPGGRYGPQEVVLIEQRAFRVSQERKGPFLRYLIQSMEMQQVLVFTASSHSADHVAEKLNKNGIDAVATHGKKSNHARQKRWQTSRPANSACWWPPICCHAGSTSNTFLS